MKRLYADLHTHTTASDGTQSPADNVRTALEAGLAAIAITDHDTVAGVREAAAEGQRLGITVVPGVEISTVAGGRDIHILGYFIDLDDAKFLRRLERLRDTRSSRNTMLIERLSQLGIDIAMEEVIAIASKRGGEAQSIGRPHFAEVLVNKGYVSTVAEAFDRYLGNGGAAYVNPPRIHPREAVDWIAEAGGTPVVAHPGLYDDDVLVEELLQYGAKGVEAYHSDHNPEQERKYAAMAERYGVAVTAGSDFHGERNGEIFHGPIGSRKVEVDVLQRLQRK